MFTPRDPGFAEKVRRSFARQSLMATIGARLDGVEPGLITIRLPKRDHILQQHGFIHGGAIATIADTAAGYAAVSLMPAGTGVLTVEFKLNFMAPASGEAIVARGRVVRPGRTLTVCEVTVSADGPGEAKPIAMLLATMMAIEGQDGIHD